MGSAEEIAWLQPKRVSKALPHPVFRVLILALGLIALFTYRLPVAARKDDPKGVSREESTHVFYDVPRATNANHVAVIVEPEMTPNIILLILHFGTVLGSAWQVVLYTDMEKWRMPTAHAFQRAIKLGQIQIRFLPKDTSLTDDTSKSRFLTKPWLWQQLESAPRVLVFQKDSIICSNSALAIENFLPYDFLGPIISEGHGQGYSGGLSIRNPSLFLKIANESDFEVDEDSSEEEWFYKKIKERPDAILPNADVAKAFAVRTSYYDQPVGYLQPSRWQATKMDKIEAYCPEVKQLMGH